MTSLRHIMTHPNVFSSSQLVDVLERWFFFCFYETLGSWVLKCCQFLFAWWRHVMTSCHDVKNRLYSISACRCARKMIFFCFYETLGSWVLKSCQFCICMMTSRHDVMSWRQKQAELISACIRARNAILVLLQQFFGLLKWEMLLCLCLRDVFKSWQTSWLRHDVTRFTKSLFQMCYILIDFTIHSLHDLYSWSYFEAALFIKVTEKPSIWWNLMHIQNRWHIWTQQPGDQ